MAKPSRLFRVSKSWTLTDYVSFLTGLLDLTVVFEDFIREAVKAQT